MIGVLMVQINYFAVIVVSFAAVVTSTLWYMMFSRQMAKLHRAYAGANKPKPSQVLFELLRNFLLAYVIASFVVIIDVDKISESLQLALWFWVGFPVVLLLGSVSWEKVPVKLAALHAGDWLIKLLLITTILGLWR